MLRFNTNAPPPSRRIEHADEARLAADLAALREAQRSRRPVTVFRDGAISLFVA